MLRQESCRWSVSLQTPEQALHWWCLRSHTTRARLWLHGKVKLSCSGISLIKRASLTKIKLISSFQILHAELRELLFPSQQLLLPPRSNEQSLSFHIWGSICIAASDPGVCGGTVHSYSTKDLLLQKVTRYAPAGTKEAAASSSNRLNSSKPTLSPNTLKEISDF